MPFITLPNARLHCVRMRTNKNAARKASEELVLLHGLAANLGCWYLQVAPALTSSHYSVTLFDLRGHGLSSMPRSGYSPDILAKDLQGLLDNLGIESAHLVGHSFGGCVGLHFLCQHPDRVRSLTLVDVRLRTLQPRLNLRAWASWPRYRAALACVGVHPDEDSFDLDFRLFDQLAALALKNPEAMNRLQRLLPSPFAGRAGKAAARRWLDLLDTTTARSELQSGERLSQGQLSLLKTETLLVYGEFSQALPTGVALSAEWPHAHSEVAQRAGHFFPMNSPEKLLAPVEKFIGAIT